MHDPITFLQTVLPPLETDEWYVQAIKWGDKGFSHTACRSIEEVYYHAIDESSRSLNAYFALASTFQKTLVGSDAVSVKGKEIRRRIEDTRAFRSVWVDLDCGEKKPYADQDEARAALAAFEQATGLTCTYRVNSGNGLHVYWAFYTQYFISDEVAAASYKITLDQWLYSKNLHNLLLRDDIASRFYAICAHFNLRIDSGAIDSSRVLRVPGTNNYKSTAVKPCQIEYYSGKIWRQSEFNALCSKLIDDNGVYVSKKKVYLPEGPSIAAQELSKYENKDPIKGLDRVVRQCKQLETMAFAPEPAWYAAICLCLMFEDSTEWIHRLSAQDTERYTIEKTNEYIDRLKPFPIHCTTLRERHPGICETCQHFGKITSPVQLARQAGVANEPPPSIDQLVYPSSIPAPVPYQTFGDTDFYCDDYGVWQKTVDDNGNPTQPVHVTNAKIEYLYSTIGATVDSVAEAVDVFRIYVMGTNEAFIRHFPTKYFSDIKRTMEWCGANRLLALTSQKALAEFMNAYVKQQVAKGSVDLRQQYDSYGWYEGINGDQRFVLDGYAITSKGALAIGPVQHKSDDELPFARKGNLEEWKKVPQMYKDLGQPLGQLAICLAFAAPFLHYGVGEAKNCVMNIYSYEGGRGKSHLLKACASVYGNPARSFLQNSASSSATQKVLATNRHLPVFMDEIGNRDDDSIATLIFTMVNGVEKQKLNRDSTIKKTGWWSTAVFTTANRPLKDVMSKVFANTDAGVLRVMDCSCDFRAPVPGSPEFDYINSCFSILEHNYGLAGPDFIWQVLKDPARLAILPSVVNAFVVNNKFISNERFYSYPLAIALTIGRWCVEFGLLNYDMDALERWVLQELLPAIRRDNKDQVPDYGNDLNEFLNENLRRNCLVVTGESRLPSEVQQIVTASGVIDSYVLQYPTYTLVMRYEVRERRLIFSQKALSDWCAKEGKPLRRMLSKLRDDGIISLSSSLFNLGKYVPRYEATRVRCYTLTDAYMQANNLGFVQAQPAYIPSSQLTAEEKEKLQAMKNKVDSLVQEATNINVNTLLDKMGI